jgi:signal transduction histidine kinase
MAEEVVNGVPEAGDQASEAFEEAALAVVALEEILSCVVELIVSTTDASEGSLMLLHEGRALLTITSASGLGKDIVQRARRHLGEGISGWVAKHNEPLLLVGPIKDSRFSGVGRGIKDALCVPLTSADEVIGVLSVSNKRGEGSFDEGDLERLMELARPAARMIVLTLAQREADAESRAWERKQLAQEIHDGPMQELSSVILLMELYKRVRQEDEERADLELAKSKEQALDCLQELRHFAYDLRLTDLEKLSLLDELRRYTVEFEKRTNIPVHLSLDGLQKEIPVGVKKNLYRIAQEALTNVRRHAKASEVQITLRCSEDQLEMSVSDNGCGFPLQETLERAQSEKRFGLLGMQERAYLMGGTLETETSPDQGTTLRVILPL